MNKEENPLHCKFTSEFCTRYHDVCKEWYISYLEEDWAMKLHVETLWCLQSEPYATHTFFNPRWRQGQKTWRGILVRTDNTIPVGEAVFEYRQ